MKVALFVQDACSLTTIHLFIMLHDSLSYTGQKKLRIIFIWYTVFLLSSHCICKTTEKIDKKICIVFPGTIRNIFSKIFFSKFVSFDIWKITFFTKSFILTLLTISFTLWLFVHLDYKRFYEKWQRRGRLS